MKNLMIICALMLGASVTTSQAEAGLRWVWAKNGRIPPMSVKGGKENRGILYICRAHFRGGIHPGKVVNFKCNIGWGGREYTISRFQVLAGKAPIKWVGSPIRSRSSLPAPSNSKFVPGAASKNVFYKFIGGKEANGTPLAICRVNYRTLGSHPGKVVNGNCNFGYGGREIVWRGAYKVMFVKGQYE